MQAFSFRFLCAFVSHTSYGYLRWLHNAQLEDDLTDKGTPSGLNMLVKGLIKNYKLDESLKQGALYIESEGERRTAASAGREALEYLAQTAEYFPPEVDERCVCPFLCGVRVRSC